MSGTDELFASVDSALAHTGLRVVRPSATVRRPEGPIEAVGTAALARGLLVDALDLSVGFLLPSLTRSGHAIDVTTLVTEVEAQALEICGGFTTSNAWRGRSAFDTETEYLHVVLAWTTRERFEAEAPRLVEIARTILRRFEQRSVAMLVAGVLLLLEEAPAAN